MNKTTRLKQETDIERTSIWRNGLSAHKVPRPNEYTPARKDSGFIRLGNYRVFVPEPSCPNNPALPLSQREKQVLFLSSSGFTGAEIADKINVTSNTVGTYKARILFKLGCRSMTEATALATAFALGTNIELAMEVIVN